MARPRVTALGQEWPAQQVLGPECLNCTVTTDKPCRGLCPKCYGHMVALGELDRFPRTNLRTADRVQDARELHALGIGPREAAARMGFSVYGLEAVFRRAGEKAPWPGSARNWMTT